MGFIDDNVRRKAVEQFGPSGGADWFAEQKAANRGGFGNTLKRIGSAAPKVAALAAIPATLGASGAALGAAGAAKAGSLGGALKSIPGIGGALSKGVDWLGANQDRLLPLLGAAEGIYEGGREEQLRRRALGSAEGAYRERAPLREMGLRGLQNTVRPDLSEIFADAANPYAKPLRRLGGS